VPLAAERRLARAAALMQQLREEAGMAGVQAAGAVGAPEAWAGALTVLGAAGEWWEGAPMRFLVAAGL
jgi:hypothetical protein